MADLNAQILDELRGIRSDLRRLLEFEGAEVVEACPHCEGTDFEDTSTMGDGKRSTCRGCGQSFVLEGH